MFFQAEDGIRYAQESRGLGDVYKRQTISQLTGFRDVDDVDDIILPSVEIKKLITDEDFKESGIRKSLNFGHTLGPVSYTHLTLPTIYSV